RELRQQRRGHGPHKLGLHTRCPSSALPSPSFPSSSSAPRSSGSPQFPAPTCSRHQCMVPSRASGVGCRASPLLPLPNSPGPPSHLSLRLRVHQPYPPSRLPYRCWRSLLPARVRCSHSHPLFSSLRLLPALPTLPLSPLRVLCPASLILMLMCSARSPFWLRISSPTTTDARTNSSDSASGSACNDYLQRTADGLRSSARSTGSSTSAGGRGTSRVFPSPFSVLFPTLSLPARVFPYPRADNEKDDN
ncbi:hypothetical protein B0H13DRAFT_2429084, partial [Mycena leptocephala]